MKISKTRAKMIYNLKNFPLSNSPVTWSANFWRDAYDGDAIDEEDAKILSIDLTYFNVDETYPEVGEFYKALKLLRTKNGYLSIQTSARIKRRKGRAL